MEYIKKPVSSTQWVVAYVVAMLSFGAYAASAAIDVPFQDYTMRQMSSLLFLVAIGGLSGLMHRLMQELKRHGSLRYPKMFIASNLTGALAAGVLAVFVGEGAGLAAWGKGILVIAFSAGGSMLVEFAWRGLAKQWFSSDDTKPNYYDRTP